MLVAVIVIATSRSRWHSFIGGPRAPRALPWGNVPWGNGGRPRGPAMPPGTYRGAIAAARRGGPLPLVCRCEEKECTCASGRQPPPAVLAEANMQKARMRRLLLGIPDEAAIRVALLVGDPRQLVRLSVACKRFRTKTITVAGARLISIVEEAARRWVGSARKSAVAEALLLPAQSPQDLLTAHNWIRKMHEAQKQHVLSVNAPTVFSRHHVFIGLTEGGSVGTRMKIMHANGGSDASTRTAATNIVMRTGRHYAEFTVVEGIWTFFGVIAAKWNVEAGEGAERVPGAFCASSIHSSFRLLCQTKVHTRLSHLVHACVRACA